MARRKNMLEEMEKMINMEPRALPVILLLDTSGSMGGVKIETLNNSVNKMLATFGAQENGDAVIKVAIITFGGSGATLFRPYEEPKKDDSEVHLQADGMTPLGAALTLAKNEIIEDKKVIPSRDYRPTIILVSDGMPNDNWQPVFDDFVKNGRSSKCFRWALAICDNGQNICRDMLEHFVSDKEYLFSAENSSDLHKFFQKVTLSTIARSKSQTPNTASSPEDEKTCSSCINYPGNEDDSIPF
jgi:uncharacterized protein YegL